MRTADFDYTLPPDRIAQHPPARRDAARMLVLDPHTGATEDRTVAELPAVLRPGDCLVLNDSRVLPSRLLGRRPGGQPAEVLLLRPVGSGVWEALVRPGRKLPAGSTITFADSPLRITVEPDGERDIRRVLLHGPLDPLTEVRRIGHMPTPPYIKETLEDPERYQTVYAREEGSAAAPTAGLHFTRELLQAVRDREVVLTFITLHVGLDTFAPVREDDPARHRMHREAFRLTGATVSAIAETRRRGGRVVAVGTTCVRVLESCAVDGAVEPRHGWTDLFIAPGYRFRVVDALLTNFHLPRSTLLMLVSAFAGRERILAAYQHAIQGGYRFYSFGDCMFISGRG